MFIDKRFVYRFDGLDLVLQDSVAAQTIVVGKTGHILDGLVSLLKAHPNLILLNSVETISSAIELVGEFRPDIVVFDFSLPFTDVLTGVREIKLAYPQTLLIVIIDRQQNLRQAFGAGVHEVLLNGFSADDLYHCINRIQYEVSRRS